ncbi:hypothetical protein QBD00_003199 [Ochrobactrum sp. AN78]|nr:hypothetical protein [Ochrobactrum sp. AN78]
MDGHRNRLPGECGWSNIPSLSVMKQSISLRIPRMVEKKSWKYLPERRAIRRPRHARRHHGRRFPPELSILYRPDMVARRKQFGHWECDTIQFRKKFGNANVASLVERVSRFTVLLRNNDRQSRPVMNGVIRVFQPLPQMARRSITLIAALSSHNGLICRQGLDHKHGFPIRSPPGRKALLRIPTDAQDAGFPETLIR